MDQSPRKVEFLLVTSKVSLFGRDRISKLLDHFLKVHFRLDQYVANVERVNQTFQAIAGARYCHGAAMAVNLEAG